MNRSNHSSKTQTVGQGLSNRASYLRTAARRRAARRRSYRPRVELLEHRLMLAGVLTYSTYLGGDGNDIASDIATDSRGNTYVIGTTRSAEMAGITSPDASSNNRAFLVKFTPDGQIDPTFTTLLGPEPKSDGSGFAESMGYQVVVGPDDQPVVSFESFETETLELESGGFLPLPGAPHRLHVQKFSTSGVIVFDKVAPIPFDEEPIGFTGVQMTTDNTSAVYVTYSKIVAAAGGGTQVDAQITKLASNGEYDFTWPLQGSAAGIAVDGEHHTYIAHTASNAEELTTGVVLTRYDSEFNQVGSASLGGNRNDFVSAIALDPNKPGIVYITGRTVSEDFPLKNPFQTHPATGALSGGDAEDNAFIALLDLNKEGNEQLVASTYFGGSRGDMLTDIVLDPAGNVYVAGSTNSPNVPLADPLQSQVIETTFMTQFGGVRHARDLIIAKFDGLLTSLDFSTNLGGTGDDSSASLTVEEDGTIHVAATSVGRNRDGETGVFINTADFPVVNAFQPIYGGSNEGFGPSTDAVVLAIAQRGTVVGRPIQVIVGQEMTHVVAEFTTPRLAAHADDFSVAIEWGDGTNTHGFVTHPNPASSQFFVNGSHKYDKPGVYPVIVRVVNEAKEALSPVTNVNVSRSPKNQIEGAIAVDPTDPARVFAAMTDEHGASAGTTGCGILVAMSDDAGETWSPRLIGTADDTTLPGARGKPDVVFDEFGNLFIAYQGVEGNNIVVAWSQNGGRTFKEGDMHEFDRGGILNGTGESVVGSPKLAFGAARNELWVTFADYTPVSSRRLAYRSMGSGQWVLSKNKRSRARPVRISAISRLVLREK